jgi:hypothetical protein
MSLTKVVSGGEVLPANTPVILKSNVAEIELLPTNAEAQPVTATNHLRGTDTEMEAPANCYVLDTHTADNNVSGIGFYQFSGSLIPHKVYVIRDESGAPKRLHFVFNNEQQTTGLDNTNSAVKSEKRIENGQLIIIKNGARYNVQGQIVK